MIRMLIVGYCMGCAGWPGAQRQRADGSLTDEDAGRLFADPATAFDAAYRAVAGETKPGFQTPSRAFGADSTLNFDGVVREDLNRRALWPRLLAIRRQPRREKHCCS